MFLYHYCSLEKFKAIIESKTLWLTQVTNSNDSEEVIRTFEIIWDNIKNNLKKDYKEILNLDEIINILDNQMKVEVYSSFNGIGVPYALCLSANKDLAQNWNEYGDNSRGISIGFSTELFTGIDNKMPHPSTELTPSIGWHTVYYDTKGIAQNFTPLFAEILKNDITALGWLQVRTTLKHYSSFIKNPTYKDEREIRIVYYPANKHNKNSESEISNIVNYPIPHCTLPWIKSNGICALKEIIIGTNCDFTDDEIIKFLARNGIKNDVSISKSKYPYRMSKNR